MIRKCGGHSTCGQTRTSLNHLKNVLSGVNCSYHFPFRRHTYTWKRTSITQCLVNSRKYTSRRNPSIRKTPLLFFYSSTCIAIENPYTKYMSQYSTWENTKGILAAPYNNLPTIHNAAVNCTKYYHEASVSPMCRRLSLLTSRNLTPHARTDTVSWHAVSVWTRKKTTLFSGHYLRIRSTLDIGVLGYIVIL